MKIIGIDPGYERLGVAIIEKDGQNNTLIHSECIKTSASLEFHKRLLEIGLRLENLFEKYRPEAFGIENLFINKNQKTAMRVAEVRGMIIYLATKYGLSVFEYTPLQVKNAVVGYGTSKKSQVEGMVKKLIKIEKDIKYDDEYDAIAIALTCAASTRHAK